MTDNGMTQTEHDGDRVRAPLEREAQALVEPFREFASAQSASGWILLLATVLAVLAANSPWRDAYFGVVRFDVGLTFGAHSTTMSLRHWVNDGLMALFFLLLGLELKRELLVGQLRDRRHAGSVVCAALGGSVLPVAIFIAVTAGTSARPGWGIPVATDTAFALAVLAALGNSVPSSARTFLVGLAIVDDLAAIALIMAAYSAEIDAAWLLPTGLCLSVLLALNVTGVRRALPYGLTGVVLWMLFMQLGIHGTLTGIVIALAAPVRPAISRNDFVSAAKSLLRRFQSHHDGRTDTILKQPVQQDLAVEVGHVTQAATVPLRRWESRLTGPVSLVIVPLFAFVNAGVSIDQPTGWMDPLGMGIALGLLIGKPLGIVSGVYMARYFDLAALPSGLGWRHLAGIGLLGGIGFTMSLFIAMLGFGESDPLLDVAKRSIIAVSALAGLAGYCWLAVVDRIGKC